MPYCAVADIELTLKELIQLCDDSVPRIVTAEALATAISGGDMSGFPEAVQTATAAALANINRAIAAAGTLINAHVGERYPLPFTAVPELVTTIAVDIATWRIFFRTKKDKMPEAVQAAYDNSLKLLGQIRDGKISIGVTPAGAAIEQDTDAGILVSSGTAAFTDDTLSDY